MASFALLSSPRRPYYLKTQKRFKCRECRRQFSVKLGTIFEDSPIPLQKWLPAMWLLTNCKNGVSSWELHRALGVTQKTAWFMLHRIRLGMKEDYGRGPMNKIGGPDKGGVAKRTRLSSAARKRTCTWIRELATRAVTGHVWAHWQDYRGRAAGSGSTRSQSQGCARYKARDSTGRDSQGREVRLRGLYR